MSAAWMVQLRCDGCGRLTTGHDANPNNYGETLRALRVVMERRGWSSSTTHRHYDWCPGCTHRRAT